MARHWAEICGVQMQTEHGSHIVPLANAVLRFVPDSDGRGAGLGGIDIQTTRPDEVRNAARNRGCMSDGDQIIICGTRINLT